MKNEVDAIEKRLSSREKKPLNVDEFNNNFRISEYRGNVLKIKLYQERDLRKEAEQKLNICNANYRDLKNIQADLRSAAINAFEVI